jgi:tetratricopeptide (TPR) repeat protein
MNAGDFERAAALLKPMVEAQPSNIGLANEYAYALAKLNRDEEARKVLEQALGNNEQSAEAFINLRQILAKQAATAYSKALGKKAPSTPLALRRTGEGPPKPPAPETLAGAGTSALEAGLVPAVVAGAGTGGPVASPPGGAGDTIEAKLPDLLIGVTRSWAEAWSAKDFDAYLGFYSSRFEPQSHSSISEWRESRRPRIVKAEKILVQVSDFKVRPVSDNEVEVRFRQRYESGALKVNSFKTIVWVQENSGWKIRKEEGR